ncbi:catalase family protein [Archangium lipolyticum]|uniref:hypothetical protein n=1 Tax=Archangium lipolyticum TaxID=2970465 RepID=UPI00214A8006|nr:hypothetical protein [Archangium lipolyticum]
MDTPSDRERAAITRIQNLFLGLQAGRYVGLDRRVQRPVFLKPQGHARGVFTIRPDLPQELRVGVFALEESSAWVRFSSDTVPQVPDAANSTLGLAIKLLDVPGPKLLGGEEQALTHDFVLQNHDVFFVDDAETFAEFTEVSLSSPEAFEAFLSSHPDTARILQEMAKDEESVLLAHYSSTVPYAFGDRFVKYAVRPGADTCNPPPVPREKRGPNYLRRDLRRRLLERGARFDFFLQFQKDPETMPLEKATVRWSEELSPLIKVATLELPAGQDIDTPGQPEAIDNLSYSPWHALAEHSPVGSINRARRAVYKASADYRRRRNHVPIGEPSEAV